MFYIDIIFYILLLVLWLLLIATVIYVVYKYLRIWYRILEALLERLKN